MKYYIITYGCQMNKSDSERIAANLEKKGYKPASKLEEADLIVVNMCSVRQSAVDRIHGLVQKLKKLKAKNEKLILRQAQGDGEHGRTIKTILTGCVLKKDKPKFAQGFDQILRFKDLLKYRPKYQNNSVVFIPISVGCNNFCTYCVVPYTRGPLVCRDHKEILMEVKDAVKNELNPNGNAISNGASPDTNPSLRSGWYGVKEIWLLGQNVNDYQSPTDPSINFAKLLRMVNDISGDFQIRFMSPNPKNFSAESIDVMAKSKKVAHYLNLPVQSGDNEILKKMNRPYTVEEYKNLIKKIRNKIPDINLSTDAIVGFPGETKSQFENTVKLFKELDFDMAYISKYSSRPGTAAAKMKDNVPPEEKKRRWKILNKIILKKLKKRREIKNRKLIVILGPTASGKSELAVKLARKVNGEVISADSRQVYRGMDIGTGKITKKGREGVPHYLLGVVSPKRRFTVVQYKNLTIIAINKIFKKGKVPILCGGTGFYIQAVVDGIVIPEVKPDWKLRKKLEKKSTKELYGILKKLDPRRAKEIEKQNPRRLIRAIEIVLKTKKPIPLLKRNPLPYPVLIIGIKKEKEKLKKLIKNRLLKRLKQGMVNEVKKLHEFGVSWKRLEEFGLEYRFIASHLRSDLPWKSDLPKLQKDSEHFAKRQMTWFRRDKRIKWIKNYQEAEKLAKEFLEK